jgi:hypothetical protein
MVMMTVKKEWLIFGNIFLFVLSALLLLGLGSIDAALEKNISELHSLIAVIWLLELSAIFTLLIMKSRTRLFAWIQSIIRKGATTQTFSVLSVAQKQILNDLYSTGQIVHKALNPDNPQVQVLEHERLILRMQSTGTNGYPYYRLAPWVILHIRANFTQLN